MAKIGLDWDGTIAKVPSMHAMVAEQVRSRENELKLRHYLETILASPEWKQGTLDMLPHDGCIMALQLLSSAGHELHILSRRLVLDLPVLIQYLTNYGVNIPPERIHLRENLDVSELDHKKHYASMVDDFWDDSPEIVDGIFNAHLFTNWQEIKEYYER